MPSAILSDGPLRKGRSLPPGAAWIWTPKYDKFLAHVGLSPRRRRTGVTDPLDTPDGEPLLSVVMPVFNERATVLQTIAAVQASPSSPWS